MGRTLHKLSVLVVLGGGFALFASPRPVQAETGVEAAGVTVLLYNDAGVPEAVLWPAQQEARRVFHSARIHLRWLNCGLVEDPAASSSRQAIADCGQVWGANVFVMHLVGDSKNFKTDVFGMAFLNPGGLGRYCDVFYDRIERMHQESSASLSRLLGNVAAHELGHLLLGSNSHAPLGIMSAQWREKEMRQMGMGGLLFTAQQQAKMRANIAGELAVAVSEVNPGER